MNIGKLKTAIFATYKHLQGYKLMRNPDGVPGTYVKMIQHIKGIDSKTLDKFEHYDVISADFSRPKAKKIREMLAVDKYAFFNKESEKVDEIKRIHYYKFSDDKNVFIEKGDVPYQKLKERNLDYIDRPVANVKEDISNPLMACLGLVPIKTVERAKTFGEFYVENYHNHLKKLRLSGENFRQGFLSNLFNNFKK